MNVPIFYHDVNIITNDLFYLTGSVGSELTISLTQHDVENKDNNEVLLGDALCEVLSVSDNELTAVVGAAPSGTHSLTIRVKGKGLAQSTETFSYTIQPKVTSIEPNSGGLGGKLGYFNISFKN